MAIRRVAASLLFGWLAFACSGSPLQPRDAPMTLGVWTDGSVCLTVGTEACEVTAGCGHGQFGSERPAAWAEMTDLDFAHIADDLKVQANLGVPYTKEMIEQAAADVRTQATTDAPDAADLEKRYPKAQARDFDGNPGRLTEMDALVAYLQMLGTLVDTKAASAQEQPQ